MKLKYIMTKENGVIIFSNLLGHDEVANMFKGATSAGFCDINTFVGDGAVRCYGESVSLNMKPAKDDEQDIQRQLEL